MLGDRTFDREFGSSDPAVDAAIPEERRLRVRNGWAPKRTPRGPVPVSPLRDFLRKPEIAAGTLGNRPVQPGERYHFGNHFKFKHKHPDPANPLVGENALFVGWTARPEGEVQEWNGLGMPHATEQEILDSLAAAWNEPRTERDYGALLQHALGPQRVQELRAGVAGRDVRGPLRSQPGRPPGLLQRGRRPRAPWRRHAHRRRPRGPPAGFDEVSARSASPASIRESGLAFDLDKVRALPAGRSAVPTRAVANRRGLLRGRGGPAPTAEAPVSAEGAS